VEKAEKWVPDLILMDLRMPGMDGLTATRVLRQKPAFRGTPIVAVTAAAFAEDRAEALGAGCDAHLTKPVLRDALLQTLGALLPLEWMRGEGQRPDEPDADAHTLPPDYRKRLVKLVHTGSVTAIAALAEEVLREGCCPLLARRIANLADAFDISGLRQLAEGLGADKGGGNMTGRDGPPSV
jgi:DNA-binding NarL/FixJ family response regulator